jgi:hypothetical protein
VNVTRSGPSKPEALRNRLRVFPAIMKEAAAIPDGVLSRSRREDRALAAMGRDYRGGLMSFDEARVELRVRERWRRD